MVERPVRVQLSRKKGWRMPLNTVSVARPGKWGNPFNVGGYHRLGCGFGYLTALSAEYADASFTHVKTREQAVAMFRQYHALSKPVRFAELAGKNLACWCPLDQPCHADVLIELANPDAPHAR